ncbi:MAG: histidine kinase [Nitrosomonas sp.]|nr:histidine kinase [Nitrosomonas sp.]
MPLLTYFRHPIWIRALGLYLLIEVLIQSGFYLRIFPDVHWSHIYNSLLRLGFFLLLAGCVWLLTYAVRNASVWLKIIALLSGFAVYYTLSFIKNVYILDFLSQKDMSYSAYLDLVHFKEFFLTDLVEAKDDILRYTLLVASFLTADFFIKYQQSEDEKRNLAIAKKQLEIDAIKWQLNPHFYFNTLNNLYGLAHTKSEKTEETILKLSDIMQYVIYDCNQPLVSLEQEIQFLNGYFEIEKLRYPEETSISFETNGQTEKLRIIPLLLIQIVENGFKHGLNTKTSNAWLKCRLTLHNEDLHFSMSNSIFPLENRTASKPQVGMNSVRNRLEAHYKSHWSLQEKYSESAYSIELHIDLKHYQE